ncbi:MAG: magnesium and cobalt transport protein CorA [Bacteroidetes bacterium]|nr:MAG: magnesium and cobalt transport protein CorA [Bacteroidota bacterium]TAG87150.1 MAG: magnesium and cobalt transport protein CorA [Bacteroidota bacterium]
MRKLSFKKNKKQFKDTNQNISDHTISEPPKEVKISVIDYDADFFEEKLMDNLKNLYDYKENEHTSWINIEGTHDSQIIKRLGWLYQLHPVLQEAVCRENQRPKIDFYEHNIFVVLQMLSYNNEIDDLETEQISIVLGEKYLITFQEGKEGDVFDEIRVNLRGSSKQKLRNAGSSYLFYVLLDAIVDNYFLILEKITDKLESLEIKIIRDQAAQDPTYELYEYKQRLMTVRKAIRPLRDIVGQLSREDNKIIREAGFYLRGLYQRITQVVEDTESHIEMSSNLLNMYLSVIGQKTNQVMKTLTIFSAIFMPLTFIAGVYGMNFENMPELKWKYGYLIVMIFMGGFGGFAYWFFKRMKWL